jgi:hypothetical protein
MLEILRSCGIDETCARRELAAVQQRAGVTVIVRGVAT